MIINLIYHKVLKEGFLVLNVENCVSAIDDVKRFWFIVCSCYVSNNKFHLCRKQNLTLVKCKIYYVYGTQTYGVYVQPKMRIRKKHVPSAMFTVIIIGQG